MTYKDHNLKTLVKSAKEMKFQLFDTGAFKLDLSQDKNGSPLCSTVKGTIDAGAILSVAQRDGYSFIDLSQGVDLTNSPLIDEYKAVLTSTANLTPVEYKPIKRQLDTWVISGKELDAELSKWGLNNPGHVFQSMKVLGIDLAGGDSYVKPINQNKRLGFKKPTDKIVSGLGNNVNVDGFPIVPPKDRGKYNLSLRDLLTPDEWSVYLETGDIPDHASEYFNARRGFHTNSSSTVNRKSIKAGKYDENMFNAIRDDYLQGISSDVETIDALIHECGLDRDEAEGVLYNIENGLDYNGDKDLYSSVKPIKSGMGDLGNNLPEDDLYQSKRIKSSSNYGAGSDLDIAINYINENNVPHDFERIYEALLDSGLYDSTPDAEDDIFDLAFLVADELGCPVASSVSGKCNLSMVNSSKDLSRQKEIIEEKERTGEITRVEALELLQKLEEPDYQETQASEIGISTEDFKKILNYCNYANNREEALKGVEKFLESSSYDSLTQQTVLNAIKYAGLTDDDFVSKSAQLKIAKLMYGKFPNLKELFSSANRIPIQQDLKGLIAMVKGWLQRVHEGLMEKSAFYQNLMRLLKGNGYPGSKANNIYEKLMEGHPVEAVLASSFRIRSPMAVKSGWDYEDSLANKGDPLYGFLADLSSEIKMDVDGILNGSVSYAEFVDWIKDQMSTGYTDLKYLYSPDNIAKVALGHFGGKAGWEFVKDLGGSVFASSRIRSGWDGIKMSKPFFDDLPIIQNAIDKYDEGIISYRTLIRETKRGAQEYFAEGDRTADHVIDTVERWADSVAFEPVSSSSDRSNWKETEFNGVYTDDDGAMYMPDDEPWDSSDMSDEEWDSLTAAEQGRYKPRNRITPYPGIDSSKDSSTGFTKPTP